jgi:hypothetical protein
MTRTVSPIERRIRAFLSTAKSRVGPSTSTTLVRLNDWMESIQSGGPFAARVAESAECGPISDLIETIAESLIKNGNGVERKLQLKALQETLFYCVGFNTDIEYPEFQNRFTRYLDRNGPSTAIQLFLSLYFFNFVWLETSESFRAVAWTPASFEQDMESVEGICQRTVAAAWKSFERTERPLDSIAARKLIRDIEQELRGVHIRPR